MTIHYHGTPISPRSVIETLSGRFFCVSHAHPADVKIVHQIGQGVMLDNGAFSAWRVGKPVNWEKYYDWSATWLEYHTTWAVIPDVIDGTEENNDSLILQWPHGIRGAPVWHMHESISRLLRLAEKWPRICIGSSGKYSTVGDDKWHWQMERAMNALCGNGPSPVWIHLLRGMNLSGSRYPFASVDSTDIARNHNRGKDASKMAARWDSFQCPARWHTVPEQSIMI